MNRAAAAPPRFGLRSETGSLAAVLLLALAVRLAVLTATGWETTPSGDAEAYMRTAELVLSTHAYPDNAEPMPVFRAPGYPVFLLLSTLGHPRAVAVNRAWNALLGTASVLLLARLAGRLSGSRRVERGAGVLAAVHPAFVLLALGVQSECLTIFLLLLFAGQLLDAVDRSSSRDALGAGVFLGLAAMTRPSCLALVPLLAAPLFGGGTPASRRRGSAAAALGLALALGPWTVRNAARFGAFLPVNDQFGFIFWLGNTQINEDYYRSHTREAYDAFTRAFVAEVGSGRVRQIAEENPNPADRLRAFVRDASEWIRSHPRAWTHLMGEKAVDWLRPWASPLRWPAPVVAGTAAWYLALALLAAVGLVHERRAGVRLAALAVLFLSMAAHVATLVVWRYRMVFWDPVLVIWGSAGAAALLGVRDGAEGATSAAEGTDGPASPPP
jgi:4-amino-4-deoxy-L-arabinose transferase-like glycosyltransferase